MKVIALISGGKDSTHAILNCKARGHEVVALANLYPEASDELDSYMYQSVGHDLIEAYAQCLGLPLYRRPIRGTPKNLNAEYQPEQGDEVEDMYDLVKSIQANIPDVEAVCSGAILSSYQKVRVENMCTRLGLQSLAYLWERDQNELLDEMVDMQTEAILIKVATMVEGLTQRHLAQTLQQMRSHLHDCATKYFINVCGEGGEYETFTLDMPLFKKRIVLDEYEVVTTSTDPKVVVAYLKMKRFHLEEKSQEEDEAVLHHLKTVLKIDE